MSKRTCSLPDCDRPHCARDLCKKHYYAAGYGHTPRPCRIPGCDGLTTAKSGKGLCDMHYARVRRTGDTDAVVFRPTQSMSPEDVLALRSVTEGNCRLWLGGLDEFGYPTAVSTPAGSFRAHRLSWMIAHGRPFPEGMTVDHLCHTYDPNCPGGDECHHRRCINPDHMEPVPQSENATRAWDRMRLFGLQRRRPTHCKRGHEFTPDNTYVNPTSGGRKCRTCTREGHLRRKVRREPV